MLNSTLKSKMSRVESKEGVVKSNAEEDMSLARTTWTTETAAELPLVVELKTRTENGVDDDVLLCDEILGCASA